MRAWPLVALLYLALTSAQQPIINTPISAVQCQPLLVTFSGGSPPYFISIVPGSSPSDPALVSFPSTSGTSLTWVPNIPTGSYIFQLRDSTGFIAMTAPFTLRAGLDTSCLGAFTTSNPPSAAQSSLLPTQPGFQTTNDPSPLTAQSSLLGQSSAQTAVPPPSGTSRPEGSDSLSTANPSGSSDGTGPESPSTKSKSSSTGAIVGGVVGGIAGLGAIAVFLLFLRKRMIRRKFPEASAREIEEAAKPAKPPTPPENLGPSQAMEQPTTLAQSQQSSVPPSYNPLAYSEKARLSSATNPDSAAEFNPYLSYSSPPNRGQNTLSSVASQRPSSDSTIPPEVYSELSTEQLQTIQRLLDRNIDNAPLNAIIKSMLHPGPSASTSPPSPSPGGQAAPPAYDFKVHE